MKIYSLTNKISRIRILFLIVVFLNTLGCNSRNESTFHQLTDDGVAKWIGNNKPLPENDSLFYLDDPAPLFRKEFSLMAN
jgi:alpha-L-rhamnosidase